MENFYKMNNRNFIRIIPKLDIKNGMLIKGINLEGLRVLGNPFDFAQYYYSNLADEICYIDNVATLYGTNNLSSFISNTAKNIFISDTYSFYGLTSLALIPVWYFFFKKNLINEKYSLILYSIFTGLLIAFSEMVRGQSGSIILLCILIYYFFSIEKQIKLKFISLIILIFPLILSQILLSHLSEKRNLFFKENPNFLYELEKRDIPLNHVRAVWHNAYYNLGFLSYYKSEFPKNTDEYSVKKAKKINPNVVPYTKEYEKILMKEYFNFVKDYPLYFIKITFAKLGVIIMYLIVFINIGIYNLFKKGLSNQVKFFFLPGIFLNSSLGLAAEPDYSYLLGMFAFASMMSVYTLEKNK